MDLPMNVFFKICLVLVIVGGVNWGLVGLFDFNAVACLFGFDAVGWLFGGSASVWARAVFTLVGAAAVASVPCLFMRTGPAPETKQGE